RVAAADRWRRLPPQPRGAPRTHGAGPDGGPAGVPLGAPTRAVGPPRLDPGGRLGRARLGTEASRRCGGTAGVDLAQFAAGGRRRAVAPAVRLVCLATADRGLSPGGEDGLWRGGPAVRDGRGDAPDAGGAGDRGGAGAAIAVVGPCGRDGTGG